MSGLSKEVSSLVKERKESKVQRGSSATKKRVGVCHLDKAVGRYTAHTGFKNNIHTTQVDN